MPIYWNNGTWSLETGPCKVNCKNECKVCITLDASGNIEKIFVKGKNVGARIGSPVDSDTKAEINGRLLRDNEFAIFNSAFYTFVVRNTESGHTYSVYNKGGKTKCLDSKNSTVDTYYATLICNKKVIKKNMVLFFAD